MRKVVLFILLLAILSGVVYLKSVRQTESEATAFNKGKTEAAMQAEQDRLSADSLADEFNRYRAIVEDSLRLHDSLNLATSDSLSQVIAQQSDSIALLKQSIDGQPNAKRIFAESKAGDSSRILEHREILDYYTQRFRGLPSDLSAYEKRVATTEIRTETIQKFAITEKELDDIRKDADLEY